MALGPTIGARHALARALAAFGAVAAAAGQEPGAERGERGVRAPQPAHVAREDFVLHDDAEGGCGQELEALAGAPGGGFAAVPAGSAGPVASVAGERFSELVGRLARAYELVLYAAPPLLGSEDADAVVEVVDVVVPLVGPGARPGEADQAAELLEGISVETVVAVVR